MSEDQEQRGGESNRGQRVREDARIRETQKDPLIRAVTNEYVLFSYRFTTAACALLMTWWVLDLKTETKDMRKDFTSFVIAEESRISKLEGQVGQINGSLDAHRQRLEANSNDIRSIWTRIFELTGRTPQRPNP